MTNREIREACNFYMEEIEDFLNLHKIRKDDKHYKTYEYITRGLRMYTLDLVYAQVMNIYDDLYLYLIKKNMLDDYNRALQEVRDLVKEVK